MCRSDADQHRRCWGGRVWVGRDNHGVRWFGSRRTLFGLRTPSRPSVGCGRRGAVACPSHLCLFDGTDSVHTTSRYLSSVATESRCMNRAASDGRHLLFLFENHQVPRTAFYSNTGRTDALYKRNRSCSLTCCVRSQRDHVQRKAVTTSIFRRDRSSTFPSRDPSFLVVLHSSRPVSQLMIVGSVLSTLPHRNQSPSAVGAISLTLVMYSRLVDMKSASSAYITSLGMLWSAGCRRGRQPRYVRRTALRYTIKIRGDSESPWGVLTVELKGADRAS